MTQSTHTPVFFRTVLRNGTQETKSGATIPCFVTFDLCDVVSVESLPGSEMGCEVHFRSRPPLKLRMFDDEFQYILAREGIGRLVSYDYQQEQATARALNQGLRPNGNGKSSSPSISPEDFQDQPDKDSEGREITAPHTRVGPPSHCTLCEEPVEDGQRAVYDGNDFICLPCAIEAGHVQEA